MRRLVPAIVALLLVPAAIQAGAAANFDGELHRHVRRQRHRDRPNKLVRRNQCRPQ